ncbi:hypothetical protein Goshw_014871 [Gossypium schwendimanii]|uniref:Uncharacterized protein n=1 Tax=Gossypium schwendimanii TaxID=34291 RepID=A0A7J9N6H8_GOSSC|nr:hypothetical protein [Gossypium schwendimanii]
MMNGGSEGSMTISPNEATKAVRAEEDLDNLKIDYKKL